MIHTENTSPQNDTFHNDKVLLHTKNIMMLNLHVSHNRISKYNNQIEMTKTEWKSTTTKQKWEIGALTLQ